MKTSFGDRFRRIGLQRRIMLFVTAGLAVMFGLLALLGLGAIDQATQLVYQERLATAYTTAGSLERDFARVANDADQTSDELGLVHAGTVATGAADALLAHFGRIAPYPFFRVSGVWLLDARGGLLEQAGQPETVPAAAVGATAVAPPGAAGGTYAVGRARGTVPDAIALATVTVRLGSAGPTLAPLAVIHLVSLNSTSDYVPATYGRPLTTSPASPEAAPLPGYHLEVVDPDGIALLGIGADERPGQISHHFNAIRTLIATRGAAAMIHEPGPTDTFAPHVMAVVPLGSTPFYVVLEEPIDVALALPNQLRDRLLLTIVPGFLGALLIAWVTTRHVVKPTEQLTDAAGRMASGDLASPITVRADDEIGLLAESLEAMRQQLRSAQEATERTTAQLEERVAERTARLNHVLGQTINAQEEERRSLARELHDETAQSLAALAVSLDRARDELGNPAFDARERIGEARATAGRLLAETRRLMMGLRPAVLDDLGLLPAIRWYAESTLGPQGIETLIEADEPAPRLPRYLEVALFRIIQEAVTNVAKHAQAQTVTIGLAVEHDTITVSVVDDGRGFTTDAAVGRSGSTGEQVGLVGMQERVRLLNGHIQIHSAEGVGTTVVVDVPILPDAA